MAGKIQRRADALRLLLALGGAAALILLLFACPSPIDDKLLVIVEDKLAPSINILTPRASGTYKGTLTVTGTVLDSSRGSGDNQGVLKSFAISVLDASVLNRTVTFSKEGAYTVAPADPSFTYNKADGSFGLQIDTVGLSGIRLITFVAVDWNGNKTEKTLTLYEDTSGAFVRIDSPAESSYYRSSVQVSGVVANSLADVGVSWSQVKSVTWSVPGTSFTDVVIAPANWSDGTFDFSLSTVGPPIITGTRSVVVKVEDLNGHVTSVSRALLEYPSGPTLTLTAPADYSNYQLVVTISGSVANSAAEPGVVTEVKPGSLTYKIGGDAESVIAFAADGSFSTTAPVGSKSGTLTLIVAVKDLNDHVTAVQRTLLDSNSGPYLAFTRPPTPVADGFYKSAFTVQGVVQNSSSDTSLTNVQALSYVYPGQSLTYVSPVVSPFAFNVSTAGYATPFTVRIFATDNASRTNEINFTLYNDGVGPNIVISSPVNYSYYGSSVTVTGTILDESSATGEIDTTVSPSTMRYSVSPGGASNVDLLPSYNTSTGAYSFTFSTTGFTTDQVVSITAKDKNKNASTQTITIKKDSVLPTITAATITAVPGVANDQAVVVFSKNVVQAAAETAANYTFANTATGKIVSLSGATLAYDDANKRTTITFSAGDQPTSDEGTGARFQYGVSYTVAVTTIQDLSGNAINDSKVVAAAGDNSPPVITSVTQMLSIDSTGKTVDVVFNEALDKSDAETYGSYAFSGTGAPTASGAALRPDNVTVRLTLSAAVKPWLHTLNINANLLHDLAGNGITAVSGRAVTSTDATAPTVSTAVQNMTFDATGKTVDVTFSEVVDSITAQTAANYSFSGTGAPTVSGAVLQSGNLVARLTLGSAVRPWANTISVSGVRDLAGNTVTGGMPTITSTGDSTAPTVSTAVQNMTFDATGKTVDVTFSEVVDSGTAQATANYSFSGTGAPTVSGAVLQSGNLVVRLTLGSAVRPWANTISVSNVRDLAGNTVTGGMPTITSTGDSTAPTVSSAVQNITVGADGKTVDLTYSEAVDTGTAETAASYTFSGTSAPTVSGAVLQSGGTLLRLSLGSAVQPWAHTLNIAGSSVRDLAGNYLAAVSSRAVTSSDSTAPTVSSAVQNITVGADGKTVDLTYSEAVDTGTAETAASYTFSGTSAPTVSGAVLQSGGTVLRLSLGSAVQPWAHTLNIAGSSVRDLAGNYLAAVSSRAVTSSDAGAPTVSSAVQNITVGADGKTVDLTYSEAVDTGTAQAAASYTFSGTSAPTVSGAVLQSGGTVLRLSLGSAVQPWAHTLNIAGSSVRDLAGNYLAAVSSRAVTSSDAGAPTVSSAVQNITVGADGKTVDLTYSEAVDTGTAETAASYTFSGTSAPTVSGAVLQSGGTVLRLSLGSAVQPWAHTLNIAGSSVRDLAGNYLAAVSSRAVTSSDATAPGLAATKPITASGTVVSVEYNEAVDVASATTAGNYSLGGTTPPAFSSIAMKSGSARIVEITYAAAVTPGTHTLTISGTVRDLAGNSFGGTSDHAIEAP